MNRNNIIILTGAGMSAESRMPTFQNVRGLWEQYDVMELAK